MLRSRAEEAGYNNIADYVRHVLKHSPNKPKKLFNPEALEELVSLGYDIKPIDHEECL